MLLTPVSCQNFYLSQLLSSSVDQLLTLQSGICQALLLELLEQLLPTVLEPLFIGLLDACLTCTTNIT